MGGGAATETGVLTTDLHGRRRKKAEDQLTRMERMERMDGENGAVSFVGEPQCLGCDGPKVFEKTNDGDRQWCRNKNKNTGKLRAESAGGGQVAPVW